ncbi:MFS transporter [Dongshaea marina]|uniref:MFS transporter n=1 Tax=Dongshaea marina TaxID=2047966 RepID=UPI000D3EB45A|nr:MFS transporter [Dongshaea marina]
MNVVKKNSPLVIALLMMTIIIDVMGVGLVFPVIPEIIMSKTSPFFAQSVAPASRYFYYGLSMALWPLGVFIGSSLLGKLSDIYGRKKLLIITILGIVLSYLLSIASFYGTSLWIFMFSRFLCGFFGGSFSLAQAFILDISTDDRRMKNLGLITLAASIGFVIGPLVTTALSFFAKTPELSSVLPFWFGAILALINVLNIIIFLPKVPRASVHQDKLNIFKLIFSFSVMFTDKRVRLLALCFLFLQLGWGYFAQSLPLALEQIFHFAPAIVGVFFLLMNVGYLSSTLWLQDKVLKKFDVVTAMVSIAILVSIMLAISAVYVSPYVMGFVAFFASLIEIILYTAVMSEVASQVETHEQGEFMGGTTSVFGIAWFMNAFSIGPVVSESITAPFYLASLGLLICGLFAYLYKMKIQKGVQLKTVEA